MLKNGLNADVPPELVAQAPQPGPRDGCRLLVYDRGEGRITHTIFRNITQFLSPGDVLVINTTKVLPARIMARKATRGQVELLFLEREEGDVWLALSRPRLKSGATLQLPLGGSARVLGEGPYRETRLLCKGKSPFKLMAKRGEVPLPHYIKRMPCDPRKTSDPRWYQTVYARTAGSVAAPTAGLHFTRGLLRNLKERGVAVREMTLHIGWGTFKPIRTEDIGNHRMPPESFSVGERLVRALEKSRASGNRVIAVGTSVVRALESCIGEDGRLAPASGKTDLFIRPPLTPRSVDGLVTNFHLPHSTPLVLVETLTGREALSRIYKEAFERRYRFYSYGDAMLIL